MWREALYAALGRVHPGAYMSTFREAGSDAKSILCGKLSSREGRILDLIL